MDFIFFAPGMKVKGMGFVRRFGGRCNHIYYLTGFTSKKFNRGINAYRRKPGQRRAFRNIRLNSFALCSPITFCIIEEMNCSGRNNGRIFTLDRWPC